MLSSKPFELTRQPALSLADLEQGGRCRELSKHLSRQPGIRGSVTLDALPDAAARGEPLLDDIS